MKHLLLGLTFVCSPFLAQSQSHQNPLPCRADEAIRNPFLMKSDSELYEKRMASEDVDCFVIPVVFHVYGETQGGYSVNDQLIIDALFELNQDFQGLNEDYALVHTDFQDLRGQIPDLEFALPTLNPNGLPTTGIIYHEETSGYGNGWGYDNLIAQDAWNNYMYMNVYVMHDLYADGGTTNSGVAWYPDTWMSDYNLARVVYNGAYIGTNCDWEPEFAGTLTHEFGHWLNLYHTFYDGCTGTNDFVADTPPCDYFADGYGCHPNPFDNTPLNCNDDIINVENFMDYSGATGCYRMFTIGQAERMYNALYHDARYDLWQPENIAAVGLGELCEPTVGVESIEGLNAILYPNPAENSVTISFNTSKPKSIEISDMTGKLIGTHSISSESSTITIPVANLEAGVYLINWKGNSQPRRLIVE